MRKRGGDGPQPQPSTICCETHSAVGCRVTSTCSTSRLAWLTTKKAWRVLNHKVWTQKKSQAQISAACHSRKVRQPGDGSRSRGRRMYLATVRADTLNPSLASSAWNPPLTPQDILRGQTSDQQSDLVEYRAPPAIAGALDLQRQ